MKIPRKPNFSSSRSEVAPPKSPPKNTPSSSSRPARTESPSRPARTDSPSRPARTDSPSQSSSIRRDDAFDTGASRVRPRRPSNADTERVRGPDASGSSKPKTNADIRKWYLDKVGTIPELQKKWQAEGVPLEEQARRAVKIRHDARMEARKMMSSPLEVAMLRARDFFKYGSIHGPNFDQLVKQAKGKGLEGDDIYKSLIDSSNRTNQTVNQHILGNPQAKL
ncbi:hypothetical protein HPC49_54255 [Pyxidicoccus fallax]|uniref:Uncharacterized protein n=1 Tax=Pyxidicoccus fallax TaxID=394095 RepID=A0A848LZS1_9BACT|nr:hypothetical protein [Pyxidicoccus fallax]NMO23637.1 hypothetical protein [Pyxidicoccus fallax]NPC87130.1 hypothetical protein [Pyxidicoccus fallax]